MTNTLRQYLVRFNLLLERRMFLIIFSGIFLGLAMPNIASLKRVVPLLFGYMTFVTALSISWNGLIRVARMPGPVLLIIGLLHVVMPLVSLVLSRLTLGLMSPFTVGMILAVIIPIGVTSVIWTGLAKGESSLALCAVSFDSIISPFIVPISVWLFLGRNVHFDSGSLMQGLLWMIVIPTLAGVALHDATKGHLGPRWAPINGPLSKLSLTLVVGVNVAAAHEVISGMKLEIAPILGLLFVQALAGYLLGYSAAKLLNYSRDRIVTMTFCVGMRNISAGVVIALQYFSPQATVPVVLAMLFQQPMASIFHRLLINQKPFNNSET
jgi:BASS family bile acid:Na+ symporter